MGTRGIFGFRKDGIDKIAYNHCDSYLTELGRDMIRFIKRNPIQEINKIFDKIILLNDNEEIPEEQIEHLAYKNITAYEKGLTYMIDGSEFFEDGLCCEWGYIINLDTNTLDVYKGRVPERAFYTYKLIDKIPLDDIEENDIDKLIIEL